MSRPVDVESMVGTDKVEIKQPRLRVVLEHRQAEWLRDAASARGVKVPPFSKRATCWCVLGAIRAANVRIGLVTLYQDANGNLRLRPMPPFATVVYHRALWAGGARDRRAYP